MKKYLINAMMIVAVLVLAVMSNAVYEAYIRQYVRGILVGPPANNQETSQ